ncbi:Hypothetical protein PBC10988_3270 [Planctomycetales bacterium 10988]|nr:Hypothetical protein PBC10988_3270 [Planctomycetales bacterium 10988]
MGDQLRYTPDGPRELRDSDYRPDSLTENKPKVIRNASKDLIQANAKFEPVVDPQEHANLQEILDKRAGRQRGKPRAQKPDQNPLGCRTFDMNCGWPMYRVPSNGSFRYKCGLYQQSHAQQCNHNHVDGPTAAKFVLSCIKQRLLSPRLLGKVEVKLREMARSKSNDSLNQHEIQQKHSQLAEVKEELQQVEKNLARAKTDRQYEVISQEFDRLSAQEESLQREIFKLEQIDQPMDIDQDIRKVLETIEKLTGLAHKVESFPEAKLLFDLVNARLFLKFEARQVERRVLNKIVGGKVTFGDTPPPIKLYEGATTRRKVKGTTNPVKEMPNRSAFSSKTSVSSAEEVNSLRNVNRGDRI